MTIHELLALTGLTGSDEIPVWDEEASGEPTKKITAQNFAAAIKTLASLLGTGDVVNDLTSTATNAPLSANMGKKLNDEHIMKTYTSISEIGLSGQVTIKNIYDAMPINCILYVNKDNIQTDSLPSANWTGTIVFTKISSIRTTVIAYGKTSSLGDYRMYLDNTPTVDNVWHKITMS